MKNYLAIDQGTTSSRSIIFDSDLNSIKDSQKAYELSYPKDGWVEANPEEILDTVLATIKDVTNSDNFNITSCGITNQRETTIVWSKKQAIRFTQQLFGKIEELVQCAPI